MAVAAFMAGCTDEALRGDLLDGAAFKVTDGVQAIRILDGPKEFMLEIVASAASRPWSPDPCVVAAALGSGTQRSIAFDCLDATELEPAGRAVHLSITAGPGATILLGSYGGTMHMRVSLAPVSSSTNAADVTVREVPKVHYAKAASPDAYLQVVSSRSTHPIEDAASRLALVDRAASIEVRNASVAAMAHEVYGVAHTWKLLGPDGVMAEAKNMDGMSYAHYGDLAPGSYVHHTEQAAPGSWFRLTALTVY